MLYSVNKTRAETSQRAFQNKETSQRRATHELLQKATVHTKKKQTHLRKEGQEVHHIMRIYSLTPKDKKTTSNTKIYIEIKTAIGCVYSATEALVFTKELGTCLWVMLVKIYPSVLCSDRLCDELEKPKLTKGNKTIQCCTEHIVPRAAVMKRSANPSMETFQVSTYPSRKYLCRRKKWRKQC